MYSFVYHYFIKNKYLGYLHNKIPTVFFSHQQDALLTRAVNIQRFKQESTALTKRNNQSELWGVVKGSWTGICRT
ncbi:hypothetical protein D1366_20510 [Escherichia coli]|nr:hypothetical protein [Escherichia coli]